MSQSPEIWENSCLTIWKMTYTNSKQTKEDICEDVCYSFRYIRELIPYIIYLLMFGTRVANFV